MAPKAGLRAMVGLLPVLAVLFLLPSCDATAILFVDQVKWDQLHVLSAVPVQKQTDSDGESTWVPFCRSSTEDPDGLFFNVLFVGSTKKDDSGEKDVSIKPLDFVNNKEINPEGVTPDLFDFRTTCIEQLPDEDIFTCTGMPAQDMSISSVDFFSYHVSESTNHENVAVAVLLDISGSMEGFIAPNPPYNEEGFDNVSGTYLKDNATDPNGQRYDALKSFISTLNKQDALIVFTYNESVKVACYLSQDEPDIDKKMEKCFSTDKEKVVGIQSNETKSALDKFKGTEKGRTALWSALEIAWDFMQIKKNRDKYRLRHILVIGDGPDTCSDGAETINCEGSDQSCAQLNTSFTKVRETIEEVAPEDRTAVHFVQLQSKGYMGRDPRQQDVACLTGGHYIFVNKMDIPDSKFKDVLTNVINRIRYTFRGYWRFAVKMTSVGKEQNPDPGYLYSIEGQTEVKRGKEGLLVNTNETYLFKAGDAVVKNSKFDARVSFRKECDPDGADVCPEKTTYNQCSSLQWWCDEQTLTCMSAQGWEKSGEKSSCPPQDVYISVETHQNVGGKPVIGNELFTIDNVETRCCMGGCMPPAPPLVPEEVAKPANSQLACFRYSDDRGWLLTHPYKFDRSIIQCVDVNDCSPPSGLTDKCVANACVRQCIVDSDCEDIVSAVPGQDAKCFQSECELPCNAKADCPQGWSCESEEGKKVCRHVKCWQEMCGESCLETADCPDGWACELDQEAGKTVCTSLGCETGQFCDEGFYCNDDICSFDFDDPDAFAWIYFATLDIKDECQIEDFVPYLSGFEDDPIPEDWDYCSEEQNCFQPPGLESGD